MDIKNKIIINNNEFYFEPEETILEVARRNDIDIPTLCHLKGSTPTGACRICVVEVKGARSLLASCSTPASRNMVVQTESTKVIESRREIIQLLLSSGNHNCAVSNTYGNDWTQFQMKVQSDDKDAELCPVWGECQLQDLAYRYQVTGDKYIRSECEYPLEGYHHGGRCSQGRCSRT